MAKTYNLSNLTILIIEDSQHMRQIIRTVLRGFGIHRIHDVADPAEAFEIFRTTQIDVIIVDYKLPTLDGIEFVQLVRGAKDSTNPYVPIIMLSAYTSKKIIIEARDSGITEFLGKPISAKNLYLCLISCVEKPRDFVRAPNYFGPERRRQNSANYRGPERRKQIAGKKLVE